MRFAVEIIGFGAVAPAATSAFLMWLFGRFRCGVVSDRYAATVALVAGFVAGYALFPWAPLQPTSHWHWLPCLMVVSSMIGPIGFATGVQMWERYGLTVLLAILAATLLVPDWESIRPKRAIYVISVAGILALLSNLQEPPFRRIRGPGLPALLSVVSGAGAIVLAQSGSMKFAQLAGVGTASLFGCCLASLVTPQKLRFEPASPTFTCLLVGLLFVGYINSFSKVPLASYALVAAAPLMLWTTEYGPIAKLTGMRSWLVRAAFVALPIAVALLLTAV